MINQTLQLPKEFCPQFCELQTFPKGNKYMVKCPGNTQLRGMTVVGPQCASKEQVTEHISLPCEDLRFQVFSCLASELKKKIKKNI